MGLFDFLWKKKEWTGSEVAPVILSSPVASESEEKTFETDTPSQDVSDVSSPDTSSGGDGGGV